MVDFNVTQSSFLGGEWSKTAQGRIADPRYRLAMDTCRNCVVLEEGACPRRPGFMELGPTFYGYPALVKPFALSNNLDVILEVTSDQAGASTSLSYLRFWAPTANDTWNLLPDSYSLISAISMGNPAVVTLTGAPAVTWNTGDIVYIIMGSSAGTTSAPTLRMRQLQITKLTSTTYELRDVLTGDAIDGATLNYVSTGADWVAHVKTIALPYTDPYVINYLRIVQQQDIAWFLYTGYKPYKLALGASVSTSYQTIPFSFTCADAGFTSTSANNYDGPYADPPSGASQTSNGIGTLSAMNTTTPDFVVADGSYTFTADDVGRQIRVWNQPPAYAVGTAYNENDTVTYQGAFYSMSKSGVAAGTIPGETVSSGGLALLPWVPAPEYGLWRYGVITAVNTGTNTATLKLNKDFSAVTANGTACDTYQLGLYTAHGSVWPSNGLVHKGRLWLFGAVENRFDASASNAFTYRNPDNLQLAPNQLTTTTTPYFSPTDEFGVVGDGNGISYTLNSPTRAQLLWMAAHDEGIVCGTAKNEFVLRPASDGGFSPLNIEQEETTRTGSYFLASPIRVGSALIFQQTLGIQVIEYLPDNYKLGKYVARQLNADAKHMTNVYGLNPGGIKRLTYVEAPNPTLWAVVWDGNLKGCTYRRNNTSPVQPPDVYAWHQHDHGLGRLFVDVCTAASGAQGSNVQTITGTTFGNVQTLVAVTQDSSAAFATAKYFVEVQRQMFRETDPIELSAFVDGPIPLAAVVGTDDPQVVPTGCSAFGSGSQQGADVLLTNSNLTATGGNVGSNELAQSCPITPGHFYFEVKCETGTVTADNDGVGISLSSATTANIANSWTNGWGFGTNNHEYFNGSSVGSPGSATAGDYYAIGLDLVNGRALVVLNPTAGQDPFGTNPIITPAYNNSWGTDISAKFNNVNACLTALFRTSTADSFTVNNGPTFRFLKPMSLSTGWNGRDYNTPCGFDAATDVGVASYGSGNDYYGFTCDPAGTAGARSKFGVASGKYYIEWTVSQRGGGEYFGVADTGWTVGNAPSANQFYGLNCPYSNLHGELCVDYSAGKMWIRGRHSDGWTGGGDPALGTGGTDISGLSGSWYFAARTNLQSAQFCVITDSKGMLNSPPSGFTAGWPTS